MSKALLRDISESRRVIEAIIHKKPLLYRPPVGLMNPHVPGVLKQLRMHCIGWNKSIRDAGNRRQKTIYTIPQISATGQHHSPARLPAKAGIKK